MMHVDWSKSARLTFVAAIVLVATSFATAQESSNAQRAAPNTFFQKHCIRCHGPDEQEAKLRIDQLDATFADNRSAEAWIEVLDRINLGEMPPEGEPQPSAEELETAVTWITEQLQSLRRRAVSTGGQVLLRRLSRTEYTNTIRDLLGVEFLEGEGPQDLLPPDGSINGFNKVSKGLLLDPSLMEKYLAVAELVADRAVRVRVPLVPTRTMRFELENIKRAMGIHYQVQFRSMDLTKDGVILYEGMARSGYEFKHPYNGQAVPVTGQYILRVRAGADPGERGEPIYMDFTRGQQGRLRRFRVDAPLDKPQVYEFKGTLDATISAEIQVGIANGKSCLIHNPLTTLDNLGREDLNDAAKQNENQRTLARYHAEGYNRYANRPNMEMLDLAKAPKLFIDYMELEGPLHGPWPPRSMSIIFPDGLTKDNQTIDYARTVFSRLLPRAYRRPVSSEELDVIVNLVAGESELGKPFHEAVKVGVVGMLCAPQFLYLFEPEQALGAGREALGEERVFRDQRGRNVKGKVVSIDGNTLIFKRLSDSRNFTVPADYFSENDQQYIANLTKQNSTNHSSPQLPTPNAQRPLSSHELATRLSYFIWSSMPDAELFRAAEAGELRDAEKMAAQVDRMLADEKADALVDDFAYQWLRIHEFERFAPDRSIFPDFYTVTSEGVGDDMNAEPLEMFREVLRKNESVLTFLDSDWTMLNERLARFYGIEGVTGRDFRRVPLPADSPRGGLIGMAGVHKWGSDGNRTKPVERGKYILDVLFNDPPPPPPPNAGEVQPNIRGQNLTVRERLEQHRMVATCANCHRRIDPYGLALENFNVIGQWRTKQDGEKPPAHWGNSRRDLVIEGKLPNGTTYQTYTEFKTALTAQSDRFLRGLAEKTYIYALGRSLEPTDRATIDQLVAAMKSDGLSLRSLIRAIAQTRSFQAK